MESRSLLAVRQVLAWASEQGMSIRGLLRPDELDELARVFAGQRPWSFELYEPLRALSHAVPRLGLPDVPAPMLLGDALSALNELLRSEQSAWPVSNGVTAATFAELGYADTSAGISRLQGEQTAAWREHAAQNKLLLLRAAELTTGTSAAVIGAGKLYDIPLRKLAERFEQLTLIDVDGASLRESVEQAGLSPELRRRVTLVTADVTGVNDTFLARAQSAFENADEASTGDALLAFLRGFCLATPAPLGVEPVDVVFSSMVLSQLATPLTRYVQRRFRDRFPESARLDAHAFQVALGQFTHRLQHAHLEALLFAAPLVAISSDVSEQLIQTDPAGRIAESQPLPLIGAPHLEDLFAAQAARVVASAAWSWQRVVPSAQKPHGRGLQVMGSIAQRA